MRFVVLESGLGGMEDATNVVKNTVCVVFSPISMDHIGVIGNTLSEIAENKAGIIKPGCIVVSAPQKQEVREILEQKARQVWLSDYLCRAGKSSCLGRRLSRDAVFL